MARDIVINNLLECETGRLTLTADRTAGVLFKTGDRYMFALKDGATGELLTIVKKSARAILEKNTGAGTAINPFKKVYFDVVSGKLTNTENAGANPLLGTANETEASDTDEYVEVSFDSALAL